MILKKYISIYYFFYNSNLSFLPHYAYIYILSFISGWKKVEPNIIDLLIVSYGGSNGILENPYFKDTLLLISFIILIIYFELYSNGKLISIFNALLSLLKVSLEKNIY